MAKISDGWTDGAILVLAQGQSARLQSLRRRRVPFVVVDHQGELGPHVPSVGATNWAGARGALNTSSRSATAASPSSAGAQLWAAPRSAPAGTGRPWKRPASRLDPALVRPGTFLHEAGYEQTLALLDLRDPPTAIFSGNDTMAFGCYTALRERGVTVPGT